MARKIYYKVLDEAGNRITDEEWDRILKLQHWFNSEFFWTAGRLAFKMYAIFPNIDHYFYDEDLLWQRIIQRRTELRASGYHENEIARQLAAEDLIISKKGGYAEGCLASGFTRVAANEWNAYLVCEFLLKASLIARECTFVIYDEGEFVKSKTVSFREGAASVPEGGMEKAAYYEAMVSNRHVFSIVDPAKYDHFPAYRNTVADFNSLERDVQNSIVKDLKWLGFESNFDLHGDDVQGFDLNKKVVRFERQKRR